MTITILELLIIVPIGLIFTLEFVLIIREVVIHKRLTAPAGYLILNETALLLMYATIHESISADDVFTKGGFLMFYIIICYIAYPFIVLLHAKIMADHEIGNL